MLLAALIFAGLPLVTLRNEHVTVDLLDPVTPDWLFRIQHVVACLIGFAVAPAISPGGCGCGPSAWTAPARPRRSSSSSSPISTYAMSILMALTALALLVLAVPAAAAPRHRRRSSTMIEALIGFAAFLVARLPARADGVRHGHRRLRRRRLQAQLQRRRGDDRAGRPTRPASSYTLSVIPLFILMGNFVVRARMSDELYHAAYCFLGHLRGGLAMSTVVACAGFGAICGSSIATAATFTKVVLSVDAQVRLQATRSPPARSPPAARSAS